MCGRESIEARAAPLCIDPMKATCCGSFTIPPTVVDDGNQASESFRPILRVLVSMPDPISQQLSTHPMSPERRMATTYLSNAGGSARHSSFPHEWVDKGRDIVKLSACRCPQNHLTASCSTYSFHAGLTFHCFQIAVTLPRIHFPSCFPPLQP